MHLQKPETRMIDVDEINVAVEYQRDTIVPHVLGQAKPFKLMHGWSRDKAVGHAFLAYYNVGVRRKLPPWDDSDEGQEVAVA
jgi:hypothetical protein